jgi:hypothetical protein
MKNPAVVSMQVIIIHSHFEVFADVACGQRQQAVVW